MDNYYSCPDKCVSVTPYPGLVTWICSGWYNDENNKRQNFNYRCNQQNGIVKCTPYNQMVSINNNIMVSVGQDQSAATCGKSVYSSDTGSCNSKLIRKKQDVLPLIYK